MLNSWKNSGYEHLFFDIFHKNNEIVLICPVYDVGIDTNLLRISCGGVTLALSEKHSKISHEPTEILKYGFCTAAKTNTFTVQSDGQIREYTLEHIESTHDNTVSITTLFQGDFQLIKIFYDYYIRQGVTNFYLYYNGALMKDIIEAYNLPGVVLIEWNFRYWNEGKTFQHHAQLGQISHALYRYGKESNKYMIFCDLDEYLYIPGKRLSEYFTEHQDVDVFGFCNRWSSTLDNTIPSSFPETFLTSSQHEFGDRSKCAYNTSSIVWCGIHRNWKARDKNCKVETGHVMFHFYNWCSYRRKISGVTERITCTLPPRPESSLSDSSSVCAADASTNPWSAYP